MTTVTLQQAFEDCLNNKTAWLKRKLELTDAEKEYRELIATADDNRSRSLQTLRDIIDVKKWEINQGAGRYIRSHENVQRISIRNRLNDFMQAHGAELTAAHATELMGYNSQRPAVRHCVMQHSVDYLREGMSVWLAAGEKINYAAQDSDILTAIRFMPDAASGDDNREKFTHVQNQNYENKRAQLAAQ